MKEPHIGTETDSESTREGVYTSAGVDLHVQLRLETMESAQRVSAQLDISYQILSLVRTSVDPQQHLTKSSLALIIHL